MNTQISFSYIVGFPLRDEAEHRRLADEYDRLNTKAERDDFCSRHGVRYSELLRLPYFNPIRMSVIDPMHSILLGGRVLLSQRRSTKYWYRCHEEPVV